MPHSREDRFEELSAHAEGQEVALMHKNGTVEEYRPQGAKLTAQLLNLGVIYLAAIHR